MYSSLRGLLVAAACISLGRGGNSTEYWLGRRAALIHDVFGAGPGVLPARSVPDRIDRQVAPGVDALVWNMSTLFEITSTVFYAPLGRPSRGAFLFHHGHSSCLCPPLRTGEPAILKAKCRPGCKSSMPSGTELSDPGFTWWDLYNVTGFFHSLGYDVFILSMPLHGVNLGPGSTPSFANHDHWWFLQWENRGDFPLRYFLEPTVLTVNYAKEQLGLKSVYMAGLSGGGWSTTFAAAMDPRIMGSFPMAGSIPCSMRNPENKSWPVGNDKEDFEQNCAPKSYPLAPRHPGRHAFQSCNYTCQYLLAGLEPSRFQVQILHEYDNCCFATAGRHDQMRRYEAAVRAELSGRGRAGWFTVTATNHTKHEVSLKEKRILAAAVTGSFAPGSSAWQALPCDIIHNPEPLPSRACPERNPDLANPGPVSRWWEADAQRLPVEFI